MQVCERLPSPNGESLVNCNSLESMPNIAFTISGKEFELTPLDVSDSSLSFQQQPI
jgi:phytepsin